MSFWAAIESRSGAFAPVLSTPTPPVSIDEPTTASTTTRTDTTSDALPVSPPTAVDVSWKSLDEFFEHKLAKLKNNYFYGAFRLFVCSHPAVTGAEFNQLFAQYQLLGNSSSVPRDSFFKGPHMGIFFADHELPDGSRPLANTVFWYEFPCCYSISLSLISCVALWTKIKRAMPLPLPRSLIHWDC